MLAKKARYEAKLQINSANQSVSLFLALLMLALHLVHVTFAGVY